MVQAKTTTEDPVVVYDVMREAANRLGAVYAEQVGVGGESDPAVIKISELDAEVNAVDPHDLEAQRKMTESLKDRYRALVG